MTEINPNLRLEAFCDGVFAIGFLLLTVVFLPFPTALLGEYLLTDHSAPAVVLNVSTMAIQAIGWILLMGAALKNYLAKNERSAMTLRERGKIGYAAFILYSLCTIIAFWFPVTIAVITTLILIFWLILGITTKRE